MKWNFVQLPIDSIHEQEKNPRSITKKQSEDLSKSLKKFGLAEPIVVTRDNLIIGGHQRYAHLVCVGAKEVDCMQAQDEMTGSEIDELTVRLNKNTASWDFDMLANGYEVQSLLDWGFEMEELGIESIPDQEEKPKTCQITVKFDNEEDLREAEISISAIVDHIQNASYKVKVK